MCSRFDASGFLFDVVQCDAMPLNGMPCFPFYRPRESRGYSGGKKEESKGEEGPGDPEGLLPLVLSLPPL